MLNAVESGERHEYGRVDRGEDRGERVRAHGAGARRTTAGVEGGVARGAGVVRFSVNGPFLGAVREYNAVAGGGVLRDARVRGALGFVAGAFGPSQALVAMPRQGAPPAGGEPFRYRRYDTARSCHDGGCLRYYRRPVRFALRFRGRRAHRGLLPLRMVRGTYSVPSEGRVASREPSDEEILRTAARRGPDTETVLRRIAAPRQRWYYLGCHCTTGRRKGSDGLGFL